MTPTAKDFEGALEIAWNTCRGDGIDVARMSVQNLDRLRDSAALLRRLLDSGFLWEAAKVGAYMRQHNLEGFTLPLGGVCFQGFTDAYRRLTAEPEP